MPRIDDLLPLIAPYAPAAPKPAMRNALRMAAIEFCERTSCWRDRLTSVIDAGPSHELYDPQFSAIHRIETAWIDDRELKPRYFGEFSPDELRAEGGACWITQIDTTVVSVVPNQAGTLVLDVILKPALSGDRFEDETPGVFILQYPRQIAVGALARLLSIPGQSWTNFVEAEKNEAKFERECRRNANAHHNGMHRPPKRVRPRFL